MKKHILLTLFLFLFVFIKSQTINLKIGPTFSKMEWTNSIVSNSVFDKSYTGVITTLGVNYLGRKHFFLSSNIGFLRNGGNGEIVAIQPQGQEELIDVSTTLDFITLNTIANFNLIIGKKITTYFGAGPRLDYLVSYKETINLLKDFEENSNLNKIQYGIVGVAGLNYDLNKIAIGLEFQYNYNLSKLVDNMSQWNVENIIGIDYYTITFTIGYKLK